MDLTFFYILAVIFAYNGVLMFGLAWAATSKPFSQYRIRTPEIYRIPIVKKVINIGLNMTLSLCFFGAMFYHFGDSLMHGNTSSGVTIFGEVLASLLIYDFMYYFMHRSMHHRRLMKHVHGVHHYVRYPTSPESIYLHPLENLAGLSLLLGTIMLIGPISSTSYLIIFFLYSTVNVLVHSNLILPHPIFKLFNFWALKHDYHHGKHLNKNYASIFPFWDLMFDTYQ